MSRIAVDVVLIPQDEITDIAIMANKELLRQYPNKIVLDKKNFLPHISLAMGCIERKDMADIETILKNITEQYPPGPLHITGVQIQENSTGEKVSVLEIENTELLQSLHEHVMQKLARFFRYEVRAEMVFSDGEVSKSTLLWIQNFPEKSSFENFFPHITLGYGQIKLKSLPINFTALKLAVCHLGNHCTCRRVLAAAELSA